MATLKHYQEVLNLGKSLVKIFSDKHRGDLTTNWMSHYLSEIIKEAETEGNIAKKRKLQKECVEVILELWKSKKTFPNSTSPLSGLSHAITVIAALRDKTNSAVPWRHFRDAEDESPWGQYMQSTRKAIESIFKITLCAAITKQVMDREKFWLNHESLITIEEKQIIQYLDELLDENDSIVRIIYAEEKPSKSKEKPDKMKLVFSKLKELVNKQNSALEKLENHFFPPKPKRKKSITKKVGSK